MAKLKTYTLLDTSTILRKVRAKLAEQAGWAKRPSIFTSGSGKPAHYPLSMTLNEAVLWATDSYHCEVRAALAAVSMQLYYSDHPWYVAVTQTRVELVETLGKSFGCSFFWKRDGSVVLEKFNVAAMTTHEGVLALVDETIARLDPQPAMSDELKDALAIAVMSPAYDDS